MDTGQCEKKLSQQFRKRKKLCDPNMCPLLSTKYNDPVAILNTV